MLGTAVDLLGDRDGKMRQSVQEIAGAVQWVNDPHGFVIAGGAAFLA